MDYSELCRLKDKLLEEIRTRVRPEDIGSYEDYQLYVEGIEEGILRFFTMSVLDLIEAEAPIKKKNAA